jgi:anti-sigma factor RsiW
VTVYDTQHLPPWTIEELAEDMLSPAETSEALAHVRSCARCAADLDVSRAMISALGSLPAFSPSPGFAEAVMARVVIPMAERAGLRRWLPRTRKGWSGLGAAVLVPLAPLVAMLTWLFGYPGVSVTSLWTVGKGWLTDAAWGALVRVSEAVVRSPVFDWMATRGSELVGGAQGLSLAAVLFAIAIPVSGWAMLRLLRTPTGGVSNAY